MKKILDEKRRDHAAKKAATKKCPPAAPPPAPAAASETELIVTPLSELKVRPVRYLVPGRIPLGKLILCGGRGGDGKSTLWRSIASDLSRGRCALGLTYDKTVTAKTLIVAAEDGPEDTILPGLLAEGADVSRISILEGVRRAGKQTDFTLAPEHVGLVRERLRQSPDIKLVIFDPIASYVGRARVDDHRASELRLLLDPLSELAERAVVTIVMIAHLNKGAGDAVDRIAGSAAYRDTVRAAYLVARDSDDDNRRLLMPFKSNVLGFSRTTIPFTQVPLTDPEAEAVLAAEQFRHLGPEDRAEVRSQLRRTTFEQAVDVNPNDAMKAKRPERTDPSKVQRCAEWLRGVLARYAYPSAELVKGAERAGFTFDNLKEAKAQLKAEGAISHSQSVLPGGWWSGPGTPAGWTARPGPLPTDPQYSPLPCAPQCSPEIILHPSLGTGDLRGAGSGTTSGESEPGTGGVL